MMTHKLTQMCFLCTFAVATCASLACAEVHPLRTRGKTLVEAEAFSATSKDFPYSEPSRKCSGGQNLGYFWKDSWFEIQVQVPQACKYSLSLRASSEKGNSIAVFLGGDATDAVKLNPIEVPKTREWSRYTITDSIKLSLAPGVHTLRFLSLIDGANVDYLTFEALEPDPVVTHRLNSTAGPDRNPLKGFGSGWWRPNDDFASVGFQYIEWAQFEPQDDQFNWEYVEEVLNREGTHGRHLILQFVVDWDYREPVEANYVGPDWLLKKVGEHRGYATPGDKTSRPMRATKYNHPEYVSEATEAIKSLTDYFQDDPRIFILQAGLLGFWSEWHTFPREDWSPNDETKLAVLNAYLQNLPEGRFTQIRYPDESAIKPHPGIGYSNGSAAPTKHGYEFGKTVSQHDLWKNGPISGEWPPNVEQKYWESFFLTSEGEQFIRQARYSTLLMPEAKELKQRLPDWQPKGSFMEMHRLMGYNFRVNQFSHSVDRAGLMHLEVQLENGGIAPFYCNWHLQLAILDSDANVMDLIPIDTDLSQLAPGESVVLKAASQKPLDARETYRIGLRMIQPGAEHPKPKAWKLQPRNVYVVLANDCEVIAGAWDEEHALQGGWNVLGSMTTPSMLPAFDSATFPFSGSVRPAEQRK